MALHIGQGQPSPAVLAMLDQEFVTGRGRRISLQQRYPRVFQDAASTEFLVCYDQASPVSALAVQHFAWQLGGTGYRVAMLGLVATHPAWRGKGCASLLLQQAQRQLHETDCDFGLLWTAQPAFYERQGWLRRTGGVMGAYQCPPGASTTAANVTTTPASECPAQELEALRQTFCEGPVARTALHYATLPLPAEEVVVLRCADGGQQAYALVGVAAGTAYVYEMVGAVPLFARIWLAACQRWQKFVINDQEGSASWAWFQGHVAVQWQPKALGMWLPLSGRAGALQRADWQLPFFDRI